MLAASGDEDLDEQIRRAQDELDDAAAGPETETFAFNISHFLSQSSAQRNRAVGEVEHQDGTCNMAYADMKKSIYALVPLREVLLASNHRYLESISAIADDQAGTAKLNKISQSVQENDRNHRGFNFFGARGEQLFESLGGGEFNISGFENRDLRRLSDGTSGQISPSIKPLGVHGLIKKVGRT